MIENLFEKTVNEYFKNSEIKENIIKKKAVFIEYLEIVAKWKDRINITGFSKEKFLFNGIIEPLLILNDYSGISMEITDIGSGAGIPSIAYAIYFENVKVSSIEINKKKLAFLNFVKFSLNLTNLKISSNIPENNIFITSRAFMDINNFLKFLYQRKIKFKYLIHFFKDNYIEIPEMKILAKIKYNEKYFQVVYALI